MPQHVAIFTENEPGKIEKITSLLHKSEIHINAISISDSGNYGIIKLLINKPNEACDTLTKEGFSAKMNDIIAIKSLYGPEGLLTVSSLLNEHAINIEDAYGFKSQSGETILIFQVDNTSKAYDLLNKSNITLLNEQELYNL